MQKPHSPPQHSVFAVWRWKRWVWAAIIPLVLATYFLSAVPVCYMTRIGMDHPAYRSVAYSIWMKADWFYGFAFFCARNAKSVEAIFDWELETMDKVTGKNFVGYGWKTYAR